MKVTFVSNENESRSQRKLLLFCRYKFVCPFKGTDLRCLAPSTSQRAWPRVISISSPYKLRCALLRCP